MSFFAMPVVECPKLVRDFRDGFKDLVPKKGDYRSIVALVCGAVFGVANMSDIARFFMFSPSVSQMSDFLVEELSTQLRCRCRLRVKALLEKVKTNPERYQFAIDDTLVPHSGKDMLGVYSWFDHTNKSYIRLPKILVLGIADKVRNVLIPVAWDLLHRDLSEATTDTKEEASESTHMTGWRWL